MGSMNDYLEDKNLELLLRNNFTVPGTVWVGLWTSSLADNSTGATAGEVSGTGYNRVAMVRNTTNWNASSGGTVTNAVIVNFGTAGASWGTVTDFALVDSSSGAGNIWYQGTVDASKVIGTNDPVSFPVGTLKVTQS